MVSFGYEADRLASRAMSLQLIDAAGALLTEHAFEAPYASFQHDPAVSER
ncbi:MAG: hypothetical protein JWM75_485 [Sphingomonas bacterium]|nr:hypothetical protein [Sphingomonas bacterium]